MLGKAKAREREGDEGKDGEKGRQLRGRSWEWGQV